MSLDAEVSPPAVRALNAREAPVSWSAVLAGATAATAASLVLTLVGAGLGYTIAPGGLGTRASLAAFSPEVGAGAVAVQVLSAALGGYLAGRLRGHWVHAHDDEAHFRDTAHGFLTWAVAALASVVLAALVLGPYADALAGAAASAPAPTAAQAERAARIAGQSALFTGVGLLLSAFTAAVAARLGGLRAEEMQARFV